MTLTLDLKVASPCTRLGLRLRLRLRFVSVLLKPSSLFSFQLSPCVRYSIRFRLRLRYV